MVDHSQNAGLDAVTKPGNLAVVFSSVLVSSKKMDLNLSPSVASFILRFSMNY